MTAPSFDEVAAFVREFTAVRPHNPITPDTRLDADLGVAGDDGDDLLHAAMERFGVDLASPDKGIARALGLGPNDYFFRPEGFDPGGISVLIRWMRGEPPPVYRGLTVGDLHKAIQEAPPLL
jgi:hypothetical protein